MKRKEHGDSEGEKSEERNEMCKCLSLVPFTQKMLEISFL